MVRTVLLIEIAVYVAGLLVIVTQIIFPALRGRPLFPILRRRRLEIETELAQTREDRDLAMSEREIAALKGEPVPPPVPPSRPSRPRASAAGRKA